MTESFHESASHEKDRTNDGLIECSYQDGHFITLQTADIVATTMRVDDEVVHYDELVTKDNYILEPHTTYVHEAIDTFGTELELDYSADGRVAIQTKRRGNNLSFMAIVQTLDPMHGERLAQKIQNEQAYDIINHLVRVDKLIDLRYSLWIRLEPRQSIKAPTSKPVVAQLDSIQLADDGWTMIPLITDVNGQTDHVPEMFTLGKPWLYIGVDYNPEPDGE
ncbi:MAG TPA: hypothetical protein VIM37_04095 [Candidatus Microsaccharimonas sp.]|jgi:hypothetical protein